MNIELCDDKERKDKCLFYVKCDPIMIGALRTQTGFFPAYHMNKDSWISILLNESEQDETIKNLVAMRCGLTVPKKKDY